MTPDQQALECAAAFLPFNLKVPPRMEAPLDPPDEYETPEQEDFRRARSQLAAAAYKARMDLTVADRDWLLQCDLAPSECGSDILEDLLILADSMLGEGIEATGKARHVLAKINKRLENR